MYTYVYCTLYTSLGVFVWVVIYIDMFMTSPEMGMRAPSIHI